MMRYGMPPQCKFVFECTYQPLNHDEERARVRMSLQTIRGTKLRDALKDCLKKYALFPEADWKNAVFIKEGSQLYGQRQMVNDVYCEVYVKERKKVPKRRLFDDNGEPLTERAFFQSSDEEDDDNLLPSFARPGPSEEIAEEMRKVSNIYRVQKDYFPDGSYSEHLIRSCRRLFQLKKSEPPCPKHLLVTYGLANWVEPDPDEERCNDSRRVVFRKTIDCQISPSPGGYVSMNNGRNVGYSGWSQNSQILPQRHVQKTEPLPKPVIQTGPTTKTLNKREIKASKLTYLDDSEAKRREMARRIAMRRKKEEEKEVALKVKEKALHKASSPWKNTKDTIQATRRELELSNEDEEDIEEEISSIVVEKRVRFLLNFISIENKDPVIKELNDILNEHDDEEFIDDVFRPILFDHLVFGRRNRIVFSHLFPTLPERIRYQVCEDVIQAFKFGHNPLDIQIQLMKESTLTLSNDREKRMAKRTVEFLEAKRKRMVVENLRLISDFFLYDLFDASLIEDILSSVIDQMINGGIDRVLDHAADLIHRIGEKYITETPELMRQFTDVLRRRMQNGQLKQLDTRAAKRIFRIAEEFETEEVKKRLREESDYCVEEKKPIILKVEREITQISPDITHEVDHEEKVEENNDVLCDFDEEFEQEIAKRSLSSFAENTSKSRSGAFESEQSFYENASEVVENQKNRSENSAQCDKSQFSMDTKEIAQICCVTIAEPSNHFQNSDHRASGDHFVSSDERKDERNGGNEELFQDVQEGEKSFVLENKVNSVNKNEVPQYNGEISFESDHTPDLELSQSSCSEFHSEAKEILYKTADTGLEERNESKEEEKAEKEDDEIPQKEVDDYVREAEHFLKHGFVKTEEDPYEKIKKQIEEKKVEKEEKKEEKVEQKVEKKNEKKPEEEKKEEKKQEKTVEKPVERREGFGVILAPSGMQKETFFAIGSGPSL
uniref:MIF4G domain-containing protein n=1 Tax=Bursaphelenchus xylophilus TaxID=6326 RepID=A0A1I7RU25_BURXY